AIKVCLKEIRLTVLAAVIAGFGRLVAEVGAVMIVGGNIRHQTRVLTTAAVMETQMGNFDTAIALGLILLTLSFAVNLALTLIQQGKALPR
ncbi:MAG: ABC transporter permease, partial [Elusimicrobiota bacterium]